MTNEQTTVIFRKFKKGKQIIAIFPYEKASITNPFIVMSYMHVGQHGNADYDVILRKTTSAEPQEYKELKRELEELIGYNLKTQKRINYKKFNKTLEGIKYD